LCRNSTKQLHDLSLALQIPTQLPTFASMAARTRELGVRKSTNETALI
jgi:hypothetical protein